MTTDTIFNIASMTKRMTAVGGLMLAEQGKFLIDDPPGSTLLGLTIEKISGQSLGQYLQASLWTPLGMTDTGKPLARTPELTQPLKFECGGGCAASTAPDYLRLAMMLMNGGRAGEARLPGPRTVTCMLSDQPGPNIKNLVGNADPTRTDYGFSLGLAVRTTPGVVGMMGSVGQFSWPGASGTDWSADPKERARRRLSLGRSRPDPLALPAEDQRAGLSGHPWTDALTFSSACIAANLRSLNGCSEFFRRSDGTRAGLRCSIPT
jgi:CubicO group peptidase (beta-lactamase class C family)